jgi:AAA ATPase domain
MVDKGDPPRRRAGRAFVGRDREVADLVAGLEDAVRGRMRLLLVAGEPGIGKTWLAEHLAGHATARGARVLWVRCWEGGGAPPLWPWAQVLRALAGDLDDQALAARLGAGAARVAQLLPDLGGRLGMAPPPPAPSPDAARFSLFEAVCGFLRRSAAARPLMLVMEDLQAADDASLLLLEFLVKDVHGARLLVVGTYRNVTADRVHGIGDAMGQLVREGHLLRLRGLDRGEVRELIEAIAGATPSEAMAAAVHQATEGNPLFVRETVRLLATDVTLADPGQLRVPLSGSVRTVIGRRLAPLSADAVLVLSAAAVVGRSFDLSLVGPACGLPVERVLAGLSEAAALDVVTEEAGAVGRYRFCHALIRKVLYERLPIPARMDLHRRVGEAIEARHGTGSGAHVAELAHHFAQTAAAGAGDAARALAYALQAGERAMGLRAYEEAAAQYRRALEALRFAGPDDPVRWRLLLGLATARARAGRPAPADAAPLEVAGTVFRREGEYWTVAYEGSVVRLRDTKGLRHLARLLAQPAREVLAVDLEAAECRPAGTAVAGPGARGAGELEVRPDLGDAGTLLDAPAKAAYRARLGELRAELEEARSGNDPVRASRAQAELDFLAAELARAVGLGGRDRRAASHAERARLNATRAIRAAMANLARAHPSLGEHLSSTIRTGRYCSYTPDPRAPIRWEC